MTLKLHPKSEEDLQEVLEYYTQTDIDLKEKIIYHLDSAFNKILDFPKLYPYETKSVQKVLMDKFPYIVLYGQYQDIVMILAIFHTRRDPLKLKEGIS